jgi:choline dehydrogenase-like flavoprotein
VNDDALSLDEISRRTWDVIVVGTGMAGATLGHALARGGKQVLFCEKGKALLHPESGLRGDFAEAFFERPAVPGKVHREILLQAGRYADEVTDQSGPAARHDIPFIGCGTGGSSALYGCALERFFPADFSPRQHHTQAGDTTLPETWPVSYEEMAPYYERAERLYRVRGSADPCRPDNPAEHLPPPPPLGTATQALNDRLVGNGLHPYRLPQACEFVPGCRGCQGFLCPRNCKNDSTRICLIPALQQYGACLLDECDVLGLEAGPDTVTGVRCQIRGREVILRSTIVVLAAGALETPRILLNSASRDWPAGLANESGLVGRNLMRHYVDLYALSASNGEDLPGNLKELAFNDYYLAGDQKLGTVQSFGALPPPAVIVEGIEKDLRHGPWRWLVPLFKPGKPVLQRVLGRIFARRILFASIMEDLPYTDNRVMLAGEATASAGSRLRLHYRIGPRDQARIALFRKQLRKAFRPNRFILIKQAENNERIAHACGTCRFGRDPRESVLNATNRAHELDNLYVVDASFFPSSAGTNPALTLAANALRVADQLLGISGGQPATAADRGQQDRDTPMTTPAAQITRNVHKGMPA